MSIVDITKSVYIYLFPLSDYSALNGADEGRPILGLEGYKRIIEQCEQAGIRIPIFAIGGITIDDVPSLMRTGVTGIAISGAIINAEDPVKTTQQFIETINSYKI